MKPPSTCARWLATACVGVVGCSPTSLASDDAGSVNGGTAGATGSSRGSAGMVSGAGGAANAGSGATSLGGAASSSGSGGGLAGSSGGGIGGSGFGGAGGTNGGGASGEVGGSAGAGLAGQAGYAGAAPTFTELWNRTLENGCATPYCHDGSGKGWSGFDKATAYRTLVGAASTTCPGETRVVAGDPSRSVLAAAVTHTDLGGCDVPTMPRNRAKLSQDDIDRMLAWIRAGAYDD